MKPIDDMLNAFVIHYGGEIQYTEAQCVELTARYHWIRSGYAAVLYDGVIRIHLASLRSLPDVAVIEKAIGGLDEPRIYDAPPVLPPPEKGAEDRRADVARVVAETAGKMKPDLITGSEDEMNHFEREKIRVRAMKGRATDAELFWLKVIDEFGENWQAAHAAEKKEAV